MLASPFYEVVPDYLDLSRSGGLHRSHTQSPDDLTVEPVYVIL